MPIYQYRCRNCGADVEKMQSFTSEPLVECPECHQLTLKKVIQPAGIIFKGSGWYITDSKKSSSAVTPPGETSDSSKSGDSAASSNADAKSSESKAGDSKSNESKTSESKSSDSKPAESKASATPAAAPAATSGGNS